MKICVIFVHGTQINSSACWIWTCSAWRSPRIPLWTPRRRPRCRSLPWKEESHGRRRGEYAIWYHQNRIPYTSTPPLSYLCRNRAKKDLTILHNFKFNILYQMHGKILLLRKEYVQCCSENLSVLRLFVQKEWQLWVLLICDLTSETQAKIKSSSSSMPASRNSPTTISLVVVGWFL